MYSHSIIKECFQGLIGFEQSYNSDHPQLDADLTESSSGLFVGSGMHPLITPDNILAVVDQFMKIGVRPYSADATCQKNIVVKSGIDLYQSLIDNNTGNAVSDATKWKKTNLYSAFLRSFYDAAVLKVFNQVFTQKKLNEVAKTLLTTISLYEGVGNISGRITKQNRLVGYRITVRNRDTVARLHKIGLQLDTPQTLTLYLFHTSSATPVQTFEINHTKSVSFQWHEITLEILSYLSDTVNTGGAYYLCYYESDLTGSAIKKDNYNFSGQIRCGTCSGAVRDASLFQARNKYVDVQPFYVNSGYYEPGELWDETNEFYIDDSSWGINLQLSIQCDVSNFLCQEKNVFVNAIAQQLTVDLLQQMTFSLRDNQKKEKVAAMAAVALDNQENGQYGEMKKLTKAIEAMSFDLTSVNRTCFPTVAGVGRLTSVWS